MCLNRKTTPNKTKHLLVENELNNLKTFDFSYFNGKSHFEEDCSQNYLIFQAIYKYLKKLYTTDSPTFVSEWKSKGLSNESFKDISTSDNSLNTILACYGPRKTRIKFIIDCLKQQKVTCKHGNIVNIYIVYSLGASSSNFSDPTIKNCLFEAVTLTKNADI